jgi:hypothetical protein
MLTAVMRVTNVRSGLSFQRLFVSCNSNKRRIDGNFQVPVIEREPFGGSPSRSLTFVSSTCSFRSSSCGSWTCPAMLRHRAVRHSRCCRGVVRGLGGAGRRLRGVLA